MAMYSFFGCIVLFHVTPNVTIDIEQSGMIIVIGLCQQAYGKPHAVRQLIQAFMLADKASTGRIHRVEMEHALAVCGFFLSQAVIQKLHRTCNGFVFLFLSIG